MAKFVSVSVEDLVPGDMLDQGEFAGFGDRTAKQGPRTVTVQLAEGRRYTETAGANVRVWGGPSYRSRTSA